MQGMDPNMVTKESSFNSSTLLGTVINLQNFTLTSSILDFTFVQSIGVVLCLLANDKIAKF